MRKQSVAGIEEGQSDPQALAGQALGRTMNSMYPRGDVRYAGTFDEDIEDLNKVTLDDVRKFYQQFYGVSEGEFTVVGQFDKAAVLKQAEELFGNWKTSMKYARVLNPYRKVAPSNQKIETPDKQNAMSFAAELVKMTDEDADYPAMIMANYMLGGSFVVAPAKPHPQQRRFELRSRFAVQRADQGRWGGVHGVRHQQSAKRAQGGSQHEGRDSPSRRRDGFTAEELAAAKKAWLQERVLGRSQDGSLAGLRWPATNAGAAPCSSTRIWRIRCRR